ncbi:MAG: hypothetical protein C4525_11965 [Desulfarculus sp.]|jgi:hypothetical protein|nr:MAG: hypothetical protein C4525_11965 [Desulfarculus sp.]
MNLAKIAIAAILILGLGLGAGCSIFQSQPVSAQPGGAQGQQAGAAAGQASQGAVGRYYDFDDIQVPNQLKLDTKRSLIFRAGKFKAGVLVFTDNLEVESLINFFVDTMQKDNWVLQGTYKYPRVALFFAKKGKTAIIQIVEGTLSTEVSIWVAPTL